jgi:hypothetical protein
MANGSQPSEVAQVILNAIKSNDPDIRYSWKRRGICHKS